MFTELPFLSRYKAAKDAGFQCVETGFPYGIAVGEVSRARREAGISQVLVNVFTGKLSFCMGDDNGVRVGQGCAHIYYIELI